jgi:hypothetical protein
MWDATAWGALTDAPERRRGYSSAIAKMKQDRFGRNTGRTSDAR